MNKALIYMHGIPAAELTQLKKGYSLRYLDAYQGPPISLTMPRSQQEYFFNEFPAFFDGLLPEGPQLNALLKQAKLDKNDYFGQLIHVGNDLVGAVTIEASND